MLHQFFERILKKEREVTTSVDEATGAGGPKNDSSVSSMEETPVKDESPVVVTKNGDGTKTITVKPGSIYVETKYSQSSRGWVAFSGVSKVEVVGTDLTIYRKKKNGEEYIAIYIAGGEWSQFNYSPAEDDVPASSDEPA